jgi:glutaredoxin
MDNYFIKAILLEGCSYSNAAYKLIKEHNIKSDIGWINQQNKENHKNEQIETFPQIYLKKYNNNGNLLLGGYNDFQEFISTFFKQKLSDEKINNWIVKTKWSKKAILRLIQLINNIN